MTRAETHEPAPCPIDGVVRGLVEATLANAAERADRVVLARFDAQLAAGTAGPDASRLRRLFAPESR